MNPHIRPSAGARLKGAAATLAGWLDPLTARLRGPEIALLAGRPDFNPADTAQAARALVAAAGEQCELRAQSQRRAQGLRLAAASAEGPLNRAVLKRQLDMTVGNPLKRIADEGALRRDLDVEAILEREAAQQEQAGALLEVVARALGGLLGEDARPAPARSEAFEDGAQDLLVALAEGDPRKATRRAAVDALARVIASLSRSEAAFSPGGLLLLRGLARRRDEEPWVRRAALLVTRGLPSPIARAWLAEAATQHDGREPFLLRARAAELLTERTDLLDLLEPLLADPSELVRATLTDGLAALLSPPKGLVGPDAALAWRLLERLLTADPEPRVRARAALALCRLGTPGLELAARATTDAPLVARFALEGALQVLRSGQALPESLMAALERVQGQPGLRRLAALVRHTAACAGPASELAARLAGLTRGRATTLRLPEGVCTLDLARALVVYASDGHGYYLDPRGPVDKPGVKVRVYRGEQYGAHLWRVLHELRHPAPSKRQDRSHTLGRLDRGAVRVPPLRLAEEASTGVPGMRQRDEAEEGWAPEVPLLDDYLDALERDAVWVVSPGGVTELRAPTRLRDRLRARLTLLWSYGQLDDLRSADLHDGAFRAQDPTPGRYLPALDRLGFKTRALGVGWSFGSGGPLDPIAYALSLRSNDLIHLGVVVLLLFGLLLGRVTFARQRIRRLRDGIPLVIGGWGTRGKSGTERLKAGLFEGLGVPFLSKTTGCEAMVLHGPPGGHAQELFLYRPYDKATIWEQANVLGLGRQLGARVLLWECMALNPLYVELLQLEWMRDDVSTITNAYPDHEDIQGPSGLDVAEVIGGFCPSKSLLVTTEVEMLPVIASRARERQSALVAVPASDAALMPAELLARLPYLEHPSNVALVAALAVELGLHPVEAVGLMAEHVVPDLGALMVFPTARHMDRTITFGNAMSANDALSFRHSWRRTGLDTLDWQGEPDRWALTVVNNRADRVARSRVFARILVHDAPAMRHVLIGTNLNGLVGYVDEAIDELLSEAEAAGDAAARTYAFFRHLRIVDPALLGAACARNLGAPEEAREVWKSAVAAAPLPERASLDDAREAAESLRAAAEDLERACPDHRQPPGSGRLADHLVEALARALAVRVARTAPLATMQQLYRELVHASLVIVHDPGATGDQVIAAALRGTPPGARVFLLGVQNIKGTGLDFAYSWVSWRELRMALDSLASAPNPAARAAALATIAAHPFKTLLGCEAALAELTPLRDDPELGLQVKVLLDRVERRAAALRDARTTAVLAVKSPFKTAVNRLLDLGDSIWRRHRADRVLKDLVAMRISHARARDLLQQLTNRQKTGAWKG